MRHRPLIGVTGSAERGRIMRWFTRFALWRAGARTMSITTRRKADISMLDGLVIGGGDDIGAELYKGDVTLNIRIDPARDALERDCLTAAEERDLPVLGICRGAQMLNVVRGGTLTQDIYSRYTDLPRLRTVLPKKRVRIDTGSRIGKIIGVTTINVNVLHHQAIDRLGQGLQTVAKDDHGLVQAIEDKEADFVVGVQWHPEFLPYSHLQRRLFTALVTAAHKNCS